MTLEQIITWSLIAVTIVTFAIVLRLAARREKRDREVLEASVRDAAHKPASLHPLIDSDVCIGSMTCISACPEGNVLGMIEGSSALIKGANCIGHGRCAAECPVDAITLVMGDGERGVDLPHLDKSFESSRKGVFVIGELAGMGLIKNAVRQGVLVMEHVQQVMQPARHECDVDVAIVGAGPAGLTAALCANRAGYRSLVLEQGDAIGGTILTYHRQKLVTSEPVKIPGYGTLQRGQMVKEDVLALWQDVAEKGQIDVRLGHHVEGIEGTDGHFIVRTPRGVITARKVILATGIRGTPMRLGVPGENSPNVAYRLVDAWQYTGQRVLVVGGGDSAIECAYALADAGAQVAISYRQPRFARARQANIKIIEDRIAAGTVQPLMSTRVMAITPSSVVLESTDKSAAPRAPMKLHNDQVIICAGGTPPSSFLRNVGIQLEQFKGEAPRALSQLAGSMSASRILPAVLWAAGIMLLVGLAVLGWDYYVLPRDKRFASTLHQTLRPAGAWGRAIGIGATAVMMLNFLLAVRKRIGFMRGIGNIRDWLNFHVFVGVMAPLFTAFHAAFQYENTIAVGTASACAVVVATGLVGRYIYQLVPGGPSGRPANVSELMDRVDALRRVLASTPLSPWLRRLLDPPEVRELPAGIIQLVHLPIAAFTMTANLLESRLHIRKYCRKNPDPQVRDAADDLYTLARLREQLAFYPALKRFMATWRAFHVTLSVFLVLLIIVHVAVSMMVGYGWNL